MRALKFPNSSNIVQKQRINIKHWRQLLLIWLSKKYNVEGLNWHYKIKLETGLSCPSPECTFLSTADKNYCCFFPHRSWEQRETKLMLHGSPSIWSWLIGTEYYFLSALDMHMCGSAALSYLCLVTGIRNTDFCIIRGALSSGLLNGCGAQDKI